MTDPTAPTPQHEGPCCAPCAASPVYVDRKGARLLCCCRSKVGAVTPAETITAPTPTLEIIPPTGISARWLQSASRQTGIPLVCPAREYRRTVVDLWRGPRVATWIRP